MLTKNQILRIKNLLKKGKTKVHIAEKLEVSVCTVHKYAKKFGIKHKPFNKAYIDERRNKGVRASRIANGYSASAARWANERERITSLGWPVGMLPLDCRIANALLSSKIPLTAVAIALAINRKTYVIGHVDTKLCHKLRHMCSRLWLVKLPKEGRQSKYIVSEYLVEYLQRNSES